MQRDMQHRTAILLSIAFLLAGLSLSASAQVQSAPPGADPGALRGLRDMNDPGNGGPPLPPPQPSVATNPNSDQTITQLCQKLKIAGAVPDFCK
jgi:hypothetical protein